ncbi:MAG: hypothetical protein LRY41_02335 [Candidatus Pacebacteria bacterium]|nr:hypothetical protein [Candidatus Paceibacterota bacterium]
MSTLDEIKKVRHEKIALLEQYGMQPFPARVPRDLSLDDMVHHFDAHLAQGNEQSITGRVMAIRGQGAINFVILQEGNVRFQVVFKKTHSIPRSLNYLHKLLILATPCQ